MTDLVSPKICPLCCAAAHESRFGAPCYECSPPHPIAAAEAAVSQEIHRMSALQGAVRAFNPNRVPSKAAGRKGTRRAWKRAHPPGWFDRMMFGVFTKAVERSITEIARRLQESDG